MLHSKPILALGRGFGAENHPRFSAPLEAGTALTRGDPPFTPPSVGDADGNRYVLDNEHVYRATLAEEVRFKGARRVENLVPNKSEDLEHADWAATGSATIDNATTASMVAQFDTVRDASIITTVSGHTYIFSAKLTNIDGNTALHFFHEGVTSTDSAVDFTAITISSTEARYSVAFTGDGGVVNLGIQDRQGSGWGTVTMTEMMLEESTGRIDTTTPSEYVSVGVATGSEFWDDTPVTISAPITNNGDGSYTYAGGGTQSLYDTFNIIEGATYLTEYIIDSRTAGSNTIVVGGQIGTTRSTAGTYKEIVVAGSTAATTGLSATSTFAGVVSGISIKRIDHGANVDGVKYFTTTNGNTVASNVVTEGTGTPLNQELISNSGYSGTIGNGSKFTATTGWTGNDAQAELSVVSGAFRINNGDASVAQARATITTVANQIYTIFYTPKAANSFPQVLVGTSAGGTQLGTWTAISATFVPVSHTFKATGTTTHITVSHNSVTSGHFVEYAAISVVASRPTYFAEGAATNLINQPRDLTHADWTTSGTITESLITGIDGQPSSAYQGEDTDAGVATVQSDAFAFTAGNSYLIYAHVKKDAVVAATRFPALRADFTGSTGTRLLLGIDTSVGSVATTVVSGTGTVNSSGIIDAGDWWIPYMSVTEAGANTVANLDVYLAYGANSDKSTFSAAVASAGAVGIDAVTVIDLGAGTLSGYPTSPLLNTAGHARLADVGATLDLGNFPDSVGSMEFDLTPEFDVALAALEGVITPQSSASFFLRFQNASKYITMTDGASNVLYPSAWSVTGQTVHVKVRWATSGTMNISIDGSPKTAESYDGSFSPSGAITLFKNFTIGAGMSDLKMYNRDLGESWL